MANLEGVKVGDRVWFCKRDYLRERDKQISLHAVTRVTPKNFSVENRKDLISKAKGKEVGSNYHYSRVATPAEIQAWDAEQAQKKADQEAREAARQAEHQARCERANRLADRLDLIAEFGDVIADGPIASFNYDGHKFEVKEIGVEE